MVKKIKKTDNEEQIKKELAQAKAALENLKNQKPKKSAKTTKPKVKQNSKTLFYIIARVLQFENIKLLQKLNI